MQVRTTSLRKDMGLRLAGLLLAIGGGFGFKFLSEVVNIPPDHDATIAEMGVAAMSFIGATSGVALSLLGSHIFDPVTLSARWADAPGHHCRVESAKMTSAKRDLGSHLSQIREASELIFTRSAAGDPP